MPPPQAHYPASCSHMSQWMDDGGYYEGMSMEAQSKHLAKLISKRCPSCQAQIEKNEGCLQYVHSTNQYTEGEEGEEEGGDGCVPLSSV